MSDMFEAFKAGFEISREGKNGECFFRYVRQNERQILSIGPNEGTVLWPYEQYLRWKYEQWAATRK